MKKKLNKKEQENAFSYFRERFGISRGIFNGLSFFKTKQKIYVVTKDCMQGSLFDKAETAGLAVLRPNGVLKPTTDALQLFGRYARKNIVKLTKKNAERFIRGEDLEIDKIEDLKLKAGYVIVRYKEHVLGCANFKQGVLKNMLPKSRRRKIQGGIWLGR